MDNNLEGASKLLARIRTIDPENAQRILGFLLMQGHYNDQLLKLAHGPQNHIVNIVNQVKLHLGLLQRQQSPLLLRENVQSMHSKCCSDNYVYYANGFCEKGEESELLHVGNFGGQQQQQQQRMVVPYRESMNFHMHRQQQSGSQRLALWNLEAMGLAERPGSSSGSSSAVRQIYLTFPADSTFKDGDVAEYFSNFGPVRDVRIPYQHRRMFGFVTFVYPETAKHVLDMGNPHFISGCRVLAKSYKEKGKAILRNDHWRQEHQQLEKGDSSACLSPSGVNSKGYYELQLSRQTHMEMHNAQETMPRRKLQEQADLQKAIELQQRLGNLQLTDLKDDCIYSHQRRISVGFPLALPNQEDSWQRTLADNVYHGAIQENWDARAPSAARFASSADAESHLLQKVNTTCIQVDYTDQSKKQSAKQDAFDALDNESSLEHNLPDNLFPSPTKSAWNEDAFFSTLVETAISSALPASSSAENYLLPCTSAVDAASR